MASDTLSDGDRTPATTVREHWSRFVTDRLGIEHHHSAGTTGIAVVLAVICGIYAAWLLADVLPRWFVLVVVAIATFVYLYARSARVDVFARGLYTLAVFVASTPVILDLAFVLNAGSYGIANPWVFVLSLADLVALVVFILLGSIPAAIGYVVKRRAG